jgi:chemotaxis response regulator CheB
VVLFIGQWTRSRLPERKAEATAMAKKKVTATASSPKGEAVATPAKNPPATATRENKARSNQLLIAALGASAGGLEALEKFFKHMPADSGLGFVIVQHLAPDHTSALPELLARCTRMVVEQARDDVEVAPNRVYIIAGSIAKLRSPGFGSVRSCADHRQQSVQRSTISG